jgi:hypothetical protein
MKYPELRAMVRGTYDLQQLRMQMGLRCCANFRAKLKEHSRDEELSLDEETGELSKEAEKIIDKLKASFGRLCDGVAKHRTLPEKEGFCGDEIISTYAELVLVAQYVAIEKEEAKQFRQFVSLLEEIPIYNAFLDSKSHPGQKGVGPAMAGVILTAFDIHKARYPSSLWKYAGLDVGSDGRGRSWRDEHLVDREYVDKNGEIKTKKSVTYNPWLKTKLMGVLAGSFLRSGSPWRQCYDDYRHRIETDPSKQKVGLAEWKKLHKAAKETEDPKERQRKLDAVHKLWPPGRINDAAKRYMVKQFLCALYNAWRPLEGLPVAPTYHEWKHGHKHGGDRAA